MFRFSFILALSALPALAQRTDPNLDSDPVTRQSMQNINLDTVYVKGFEDGTNAFRVPGGPGTGPMVAISLERDLLPAVQGNLDRESLERVNGETR